MDLQFRSKRALLCAVVLLFVFSAAAAAEPQSFDNPTYDLGASIGLWASGDIYFGWPDDYYEKDGSFLFRAFIDGYLMPKFATGVYINLSKVTISDFDEEGSMFEIGVSMKPRFMISPEAAVKPGLNIGYRTTDADSDIAESEGLGINLSVELQYQPPSLKENGLYIFLDTGFFSQPAGGNEDQDITFGPIFYIAAGVGI